MKNKEIAEKIRKLLALSESPNRAEAELAAKKAKELLDKYNISMSTVDLIAEGVIQRDLHLEREVIKGKHEKYYKQIPPWIRQLCGVIQKYFYVEIYSSKSAKDYTYFVFFGSPADVDMASYVFQYLQKSIERLTEAFVKNRSYSRGERLGFEIGCVTGIQSALEEQNEVVSAEPGFGAMIVVKGNQIKKFMNDTGIKTYTKNHNSTVPMDSAAYFSGVKAGKNIDIPTGIPSSSKVQKRIE